MGTDLRHAAIERYLRSLASPRWQATAKGVAKSKAKADAGTEDDDSDDSDDDATDADADDESDEDQEDSEDDDESDDSEDGDAEDDDDAEDASSTSKSRPGFKVPKSQAQLDAMILKRLERKEREVREEIDREQKLATAKKRGQSDKVIAALEAEVERLKSLHKETSLVEVKARVAEKVGLPASAAKRLTGENEAQLLADAKAMKKELGIEAAKKPRKPDDRGESNKARGAGKTSGEQEDWKKPEFWIQD